MIGRWKRWRENRRWNAAAQTILDDRDIRDVADALGGRDSVRERTAHLEDDAEISKDRADGSERRESEWSKHKDHHDD